MVALFVVDAQDVVHSRCSRWGLVVVRRVVAFITGGCQHGVLVCDVLRDVHRHKPNACDWAGNHWLPEVDLCEQWHEEWVTSNYWWFATILIIEAELLGVMLRLRVRVRMRTALFKQGQTISCTAGVNLGVRELEGSLEGLAHLLPYLRKELGLHSRLKP